MISTAEVKGEFDTFRSRYEKVSGMLELFKRDKETLELAVSSLQDEVDYLSHAAIILEKFIRDSNEEALQELQETLNTGIKLNFPDFESELDIDYKVTPSTQRIIFRFKKGEFFEEVKGAQSGGMIEVVAFLSRIVFTVQKNWRRALFLDEAFSGVSENAEYCQLTSSLLATVAEKQGFDILINTHKADLAELATTRYKIGKEIPDEGLSYTTLERVL